MNLSDQNPQLNLMKSSLSVGHHQYPVVVDSLISITKQKEKLIHYLDTILYNRVSQTRGSDLFVGRQISQKGSQS